MTHIPASQIADLVLYLHPGGRTCSSGLKKSRWHGLAEHTSTQLLPGQAQVEVRASASDLILDLLCALYCKHTSLQVWGKEIKKCIGSVLKAIPMGWFHL